LQLNQLKKAFAMSKGKFTYPSLAARSMMILAQIELFTGHHIMRIYQLQNVILEGEQALSQEHAKVNQSLSDAIISENRKFPYYAANYMAETSATMNKLSNLEDIVNTMSLNIKKFTLSEHE
ncbi:hypothetical protein Tco_1047560, partial [Tanacetum coccineum]